MVVLPVPVPAVKLRPAVPLRVSVPLVAVRVSCIGALPASGSAIEIVLPLALEKTNWLFSTTDCAPGTVLTGGWLTTEAAKQGAGTPATLRVYGTGVPATEPPVTSLTTTTK